MGRANNRKLLVENFNSVLGANRGSASAQARRDIDERQELAVTLRAWCQQIANKSGRERIGPILSKAFLQGANTVAAPGYAKFMDELTRNTASEAVAELAVIAEAGDPPQCEGLTAPAIQALGDYFTRAATTGVNAFAQADCVRTLDVCFPAPHITHRNTYYRRLQPLCEGLGSFIGAIPRKGVNGEDDFAVARTCARAVEVFRRAPPPAVSGPLRSWVKALATCLETGNISAEEVMVLREIVKRRGNNRRFANAFAPVIGRLGGWN